MEIQEKEFRVLEMFGVYGQASMAANGVEQQLINLLIAYERLTNPNPPPFAEFVEEIYYKNIGPLIQRLKTKVPLPDSILSDLEVMREKRNFLVHHFFRERIALVAAEQFSELTAELIPLRELLNQMYAKLNPVLEDAIVQMKKLKA